MSIIKGKKVGSADITSTYDSSTTLSDSERLTVVGVNLSEYGSISTPSSVIYDGTAHTPLPTVTATVGGETVTLIKDTDYTLSYSNNTNAGTATVTATGIGNFTGSTSVDWTINPAQITVSYSDQSYVYNGTLQGTGISDVSVVDGEPTIRYGLTVGTYNLSDVPTFRNVSNNTVYFKVSAPNHQDNTGSYELNITPKVASLDWGETNWRYDGNPHSTTCVVSNLVSGDSCDVVLTGTNSVTNVGDISRVHADHLTNSNYTLDGLSATDLYRDLTISAGLFVKLSGTWTPVKGVYKRIGGSWVEQDMMSSFSVSERYKKMN